LSSNVNECKPLKLTMTSYCLQYQCETFDTTQGVVDITMLGVMSSRCF
jgi:hypothetical protein